MGEAEVQAGGGKADAATDSGVELMAETAETGSVPKTELDVVCLR